MRCARWCHTIFSPIIFAPFSSSTSASQCMQLRLRYTASCRSSFAFFPFRIFRRHKFSYVRFSPQTKSHRSARPLYEFCTISLLSWYFISFIRYFDLPHVLLSVDKLLPPACLPKRSRIYYLEGVYFWISYINGGTERTEDEMRGKEWLGRCRWTDGRASRCGDFRPIPATVYSSTMTGNVYLASRAK